MQNLKSIGYILAFLFAFIQGCQSDRRSSNYSLDKEETPEGSNSNSCNGYIDSKKGCISLKERTCDLEGKLFIDKKCITISEYDCQKSGNLWVNDSCKHKQQIECERSGFAWDDKDGCISVIHKCEKDGKIWNNGQCVACSLPNMFNEKLGCVSKEHLNCYKESNVWLQDKNSCMPKQEFDCIQKKGIWLGFKCQNEKDRCLEKDGTAWNTYKSRCMSPEEVQCNKIDFSYFDGSQCHLCSFSQKFSSEKNTCICQDDEMSKYGSNCISKEKFECEVTNNEIFAIFDGKKLCLSEEEYSCLLEGKKVENHKCVSQTKNECSAQFKNHLNGGCFNEKEFNCRLIDSIWNMEYNECETREEFCINSYNFWNDSTKSCEEPKGKKPLRNGIEMAKNYHPSMSFCLKSLNDTNCTPVEITDIKGDLGSKNAFFLKDARIVLYPGNKFYSYEIPEWWENSISNEDKFVKDLESYGIPVLNRKKATLTIKNLYDHALDFSISVLVSDSFDQYTDRGWFIFDSRSPRSSTWNKTILKTLGADYHVNDLGSSPDDLEIWKEVVRALFQDAAKIYKYNIPNSIDFFKFAVEQIPAEKKKNANWQLRTFGVNQSEKFFSMSTSKPRQRISKYALCMSIRSLTSIVIDEFIDYQCHGESWSDSIARKHRSGYAKFEKKRVECEAFKNKIYPHLMSCDNILEAVKDAVEPTQWDQ